MCCSVLCGSAVGCSVLCGSAVGCSVVQFAVVYYDVLQCITVLYGVLMKGSQALVVFTGPRGGSHGFYCYIVLQCVTLCDRLLHLLQCVAVSVLQCFTVCYCVFLKGGKAGGVASVSREVVMCCSVLHHVAVCCIMLRLCQGR